jgi:hypothetical protein
MPFYGRVPAWRGRASGRDALVDHRSWMRLLSGTRVTHEGCSRRSVVKIGWPRTPSKANLTRSVPGVLPRACGIYAVRVEVLACSEAVQQIALLLSDASKGRYKTL